MMDVALSVMALIAGGLVLELFTDTYLSFAKAPGTGLELPAGDFCEEAGNPS